MKVIVSKIYKCEICGFSSDNKEDVVKDECVCKLQQKLGTTVPNSHVLVALGLLTPAVSRKEGVQFIKDLVNTKYCVAEALKLLWQRDLILREPLEKALTKRDAYDWSKWGVELMLTRYAGRILFPTGGEGFIYSEVEWVSRDVRWFLVDQLLCDGIVDVEKAQEQCSSAFKKPLKIEEGAEDILVEEEEKVEEPYW